MMGYYNHNFLDIIFSWLFFYLFVLVSSLKENFKLKTLFNPWVKIVLMPFFMLSVYLYQLILLRKFVFCDIV